MKNQDGMTIISLVLIMIAFLILAGITIAIVVTYDKNELNNSQNNTENSVNYEIENLENIELEKKEIVEQEILEEDQENIENLEVVE